MLQRVGRWSQRWLIVALALTTLGLLAIPSGAPATLDYRVFRPAQARAFNPASYMVGTLFSRWRDGALAPAEAAADSAEDVALVRRFLNSPGLGDAALRSQVERILQRQIAATLSELELEWSVFGQDQVFPPVQFAFVNLPDVLVVSRRDRIERIGAHLLRGGVTDSEAAALETRSDAEGVSTLVVKIGGLAVYPSMIPKVNSIEWLMPTLAHEWAHQFFALQPVGWRFTLDLERDPNMITLNESAAELIGDEIGWRALARYYGLNRPDSATAGAANASGDTQTAFARRMLEIRQRADTLFAAGHVEAAEQYLETARQALAADGYRIRKLNQAYFAFYGSYASAPGSVSPIGQQLKTLRERQPRLRDFLFAVARLNSPTELAALVER